MSECEEHASVKLDEAKFYLALMDRIETEGSSLTGDRDPESEFGYLLSAFLNACYSSGEYLKQEPANRAAVKDFRNQHGAFYKSGPNGGWRTRVVHFRPVVPGHKGYIPPPGNNVILRMERTQKKVPGDSVPLELGPGAFYFSSGEPQNSICDLCAQHLLQLNELIRQCARQPYT